MLCLSFIFAYLTKEHLVKCQLGWTQWPLDCVLVLIVSQIGCSDFLVYSSKTKTHIL